VRNFVAPLIKLVIFLVVTTFATFVLGETIANSSYGSTNTYHADFSDVTGLQIGDDVRIAGVRVGTVQDIQIKEYETKQLGKRGYAYVTFTATKDAKVPASAIVDLTVLFGGFKYLIQGLDAQQINQLSYAVIQTLQGEGGALENLFGVVADLTNSLADKDKVIGEVIDNLSSVLQAVGQRDSELGNLITELRDFMSGLASDRTTIGNAIVGVNRLAESTSGLLAQVRGPLAQDIKSITNLTDNLNANSSTITYVLQQLPPTVAGLIRTADYGSWFNFYLCSFSAILTLPGNTKYTLHNLAYGSAKRCNS
jgi:phospholipid/cholesterol/gamma-HCH transport system substrate-binding protein